jgi:hypothetical protein
MGEDRGDGRSRTILGAVGLSIASSDDAYAVGKDRRTEAEPPGSYLLGIDRNPHPPLPSMPFRHKEPTEPEPTDLCPRKAGSIDAKSRHRPAATQIVLRRRY